MIQERLKKVEDIKHSINLNKVSLNVQPKAYVFNLTIILYRHLGKSY